MIKQIILNIKYIYNNIKWFWRFIYKFRPYDYGYNIQLLQQSLKYTDYYIQKNGHHHDCHKEMIHISISKFNLITENILKDNYISLSEIELGLQYNNNINNIHLTSKQINQNKMITNKAHTIKQNQLSELSDIIFMKNKYKNFGLLSWWD